MTSWSPSCRTPICWCWPCPPHRTPSASCPAGAHRPAAQDRLRHQCGPRQRHRPARAGGRLNAGSWPAPALDVFVQEPIPDGRPHLGRQEPPADASRLRPAEPGAIRGIRMWPCSARVWRITPPAVLWPATSTARSAIDVHTIERATRSRKTAGGSLLSHNPLGVLTPKPSPRIS